MPLMGIASAGLVSWQTEGGVPCASERDAEQRALPVGGRESYDGYRAKCVLMTTT
jgi:hypothetical protein